MRLGAGSNALAHTPVKFERKPLELFTTGRGVTPELEDTRHSLMSAVLIRVERFCYLLAVDESGVPG